jgi:hypothetical protein
MQWDLGLQGVALLGAMSLGFGVFALVVAGKGLAHRLLTGAITTVACFGVGLVTSEGMFGWATEEDLQPNIDGLSRDEALLSSVLTTVLVLVVMRLVARREGAQRSHSDWIGHQGRHRHA